MSSFRDILVAVDGSETSWQALDHAIGLAGALHARLTVITVVGEVPPFVDASVVDVAAVERDAERCAQEVLRAAVDRVPADVSVTSMLRRGRPGHEILRQVEAGRHDLVVLGSRGRGRVRSALLGSVGAAVHAHVHVPMLVVHPDGVREPAAA